MASPFRMIGNIAITVFLTVTAIIWTSTPLQAGCGEPMLRLGQTPIAHDSAPENPSPCHGPNCSESPTTPLAPLAPAPLSSTHEVKWGNLGESYHPGDNVSHWWGTERNSFHFREWSFVLYHPPRSI